jgi:hypothetical protein
MLSTVFRKLCLLFEHFAAGVAFEGFAARVNSQVINQVALLGKLFAAEATDQD